jgi:HTH domain
MSSAGQPCSCPALLLWVATVGLVTPGADAQSDDIGFLRALQPIVEYLGGGLVSASEAGPGDLPVERDGRVLAHVRSNELHSALDRIIETVERDAGAELSAMNRAQKQVAVRTLDEQGVFLLRGAVDQVAKSMGVSRVTLYSYLNALERRA